jgi:hypothetical protein
MKQIEIENIENGIEWLAEGFARMMAECAVLCLESQDHESGVLLKMIDLENAQFDFSVKWGLQITEPMRRSYQDEKRATDQGANCLAILLTLKLTGYTRFTTSATQNGIDFWLEAGDETDYNFMAARLEISGIRKESKSNTLERRVKTKRKQATKSENTGLLAYISVTEFSTPKSAYVL